MTEWISVKDRMPSEDKDDDSPRWYLVYGNGRCDIALCLHGESFMGHALQFNDVTHWQPLPSPPKEKV